jgi:hypothetical protein
MKIGFWISVFFFAAIVVRVIIGLTIKAVDGVPFGNEELAIGMLGAVAAFVCFVFIRNKRVFLDKGKKSN